MRQKIAIGISIAACISLYIGMNVLAKALEFPTYIDFGETTTVTRGSGRYSYDEEIDGETTDVGFYILIVSVMLAWRIYHWVLSGKPGGNLPLGQRITWRYWFLGLTAFVVLTTPIWESAVPDALEGVLVLAIGAGIAWFSHKKCQESLSKVRNEKGT